MHQYGRLFLDVIAQSRPPRSALLNTLSAGTRLCGLNAGAIYFADYESQQLACLIHSEDGQAETAPRVAFDADDSLVARVFLNCEASHSKHPQTDPGVYQEGVRYFGIESVLFGAPLIHEGRILGVLLLWGRNFGEKELGDLDACQEFASLAASYLATTIVAEQQASRLRQLRSVVTGVGESVTQTEALRAVMHAIADSFDRVRFFRYNIDERRFHPVDSVGMEDPERFLRETYISVDRNPHAARTVNSFPEITKAERYEGTDPDADLLDKPAGIEWVVVPLGIGGELIGQIVADNALTRRPITDDSLEYVDAVSALAATAIASRESIQFLSLNALPTLYSSLASASNRYDVIRRLLIFLTCGESLGFSRGIFLEYHPRSDQLVYRASVGSVNEHRFRVIAPLAAGIGLANILVQDNYDYELDQRLTDFTVPLVSRANRDLLQDVRRTPLRVRESPLSEEGDLGSNFLPWAQDLANRIGETEALTVPIRSGTDILGMFIADRCWQPRAVRDVDLLALRTFSQVAAQILKQYRVHELHTRRRVAEYSDMMGIFAAHAIKKPASVIALRAGTLTVHLERQELEAAREDSVYISRQAAKLNTFVNRLMSLASIFKIRPGVIHLRPLLEDAWSSVAEEAAGTECSIDCPDSIAMEGDRDHLKLCFEEILNNAIRALDTKEERRIRIEVGTPGPSWIPLTLDASLRYAVIHFEDNGPGIDSEFESKIFEPGFSTREGGTGIGLFAVKEVIERHRGMVTNYCCSGSGTTFAIFLPLIDRMALQFPANSGMDPV